MRVQRFYLNAWPEIHYFGATTGLWIASDFSTHQSFRILPDCKRKERFEIMLTL